MIPTSSKLYYSVCPLLPWNLQSHIPPNLSSIYLYLIYLYLSRSQTSIQFRKLPVQPQGRQRQTHPKMLVDLKLKDSETSHRPFLLGQTARVSNRPVDSTKKQVHLGWLHMRPIWWHLQNHLTIPEALEKVPPPKVSPSILKMVAPGSQCPRLACTPTQPCSSDCHSDRQHYSSCLYKQGRRHEVGPTLCPIMEDSDLVLQEMGN